MLINSTLYGACKAPFYDASLFPLEGGFVGGRLCAAQDQLPDSPVCCLPCPATYWTYPDNFNSINAIAGWLNVVGLILLVFMLVSYTVLPAAKTRSHYLTICLIIAVIFIHLAFVIPLGAQPEQCYNGITPNDMYSSMTCAWSGAFLLAGALAGSFWIFIRALSMHLQVCWDIVPGLRFFYISQAVGWGVPVALFTAAISIAGVSFRFGNACHINHDDSMVTFWGWLLAVAGAAVITQLSTFGYCMHVFFSSLWQNDNRPSSRCSKGSLPLSSASMKSQRARAIYHRLKSVLYLQWRGIAIVTIVLVDVIFFAIIFVYLDRTEASAVSDNRKILPWLHCLVASGGDRNACLPLSHEWLISEPAVDAMLIMISLVGIELFILLFRWSLITGWSEMWSKRKSRELVTFNSQPPKYKGSPSTSPTNFELRRVGKSYTPNFDAKSISSSAMTEAGTTRPDYYADLLSNSAPQSPVGVYSPRRRNEDDQPLGIRPAPPVRNFSSPKLRMHDTMGWDPSSTFATSGARYKATPILPPEDESARRTPPGQAL